MHRFAELAALACTVALALAGASSAGLAQAPAAPLVPLQPKMVNAGPADIVSGVVRLPDPSQVAHSSQSALLPVRFDDGGRWSVAVPAEGFGELSLVPLSPEAQQWRITLAEPGQPPRTLASWLDERRASSTTGPLGVLPGPWATRWDLATDRMGSWTITIGHRPGAADGLLLLGGTGPARLVSHTTSWRLTSDRSVGLVVFSPGGQLLAAEATVSVFGSPVSWPLADDGKHGDGGADDGVFGMVLPPLPAGEVHVSIVGRGVGQDGLPFLRTTEHLLAIADPVLQLTGAVSCRVEGDDRLAFDLGATLVGPAKPVHVSAEVWTADGAQAVAPRGHRPGTRASAPAAAVAAEAPVAPVAPVGWMSTMATPKADGTLSLSLHGAWLARAGAGQQLLLRNLRVQDVNTHAVLDLLADTPVFAAQLPDAALQLAPANITSAMFTGVSGLSLVAAVPGGSAEPGLGRRPRDTSAVVGAGGPMGPLNPPERALLLVHGYYSSPVWPPADFTGQKLIFEDLNANRSHDEFAQLIAALGAPLDSFGVVAHSQGGPASLHLLTYYTSGLDFAVGGLRIQSLGSPYLGTPLAGSLGGIGQVFGVGCGSNTDLSESGAALWAAGIPSWARAEVTAYTTSFSGFWCDFVTNLVLDNPEDGVTELDLALLSGMNVMPHFVGQCHTTGMSDPAQYKDSGRNAVMNAAAAR